MNGRNISRRECIELGAACIAIGVLGVAWDSLVNEGRPASAEPDEPSEDGGEEPP